MRDRRRRPTLVGIPDPAPLRLARAACSLHTGLALATVCAAALIAPRAALADPATAPATSAATATATAAATATAPPANCTGPEYRRFDFWIGRWRVTANGKLAGHNRIESILDGCALAESWRGASGSTGRSLNYYDAARGTWHQTWIDSSGQPLQLDGAWQGGAMQLAGETRDREGTLRQRITWTPRPGGAVRQLWETSRDGRNWSTVFDGLYERE